jgi:gamma-tubulin complex component 5
VREVLGALQGQETARVFRSGNEGIEVSIQGSLLHLSPASFRSLLATFLPSLTSLHILDTFVRRTISRTTTSLPYSWGRTIEAFAESIDLVLRSYRHRCVAQSLALLNPTSDTIVSLLQLSHDIELRSKPLLQLVKAVELIKPDGQHPSETVSTLIEYLQSEVDLAYELGDEEAAEGLRAVFVRTVEPLWRSIGDWVRKGRLGERTDEFFVRRDGDIEIDAPEFLRDGFVSREKKAVPSMFGDVREGVLECGKVMHLLKTIGPDVEWLEDDAEWPRFGDLMLDKGRPTIEQDDTPVSSPLDIVRHALLRTEVATARPRTKTIYAPLPPFTSFSQSVADTISESCLPLFRVIQYRLHRVFLDECQFGHHLAAVQGIFLMRRGWEVGTFLGSVFERVRPLLSWCRAVANVDAVDGSRPVVVRLPTPQFKLEQSRREIDLDRSYAR